MLKVIQSPYFWHRAKTGEPTCSHCGCTTAGDAEHRRMKDNSRYLIRPVAPPKTAA